MTPTLVRPKISVVIPALNEASHIGICLQSVHQVLPDAEILVVDGGSTDETMDLATLGGALVFSAPRGRGTQCNAGGRRAMGEVILFLHADTTLPSDAHELITAGFDDPDTQIALFRLGFDEDHPLLRFYAFFTRFDSEWFKFGDQAIVLRREVFRAVGGFPDWPLLEDVEILRRVRRYSKIRIFPSAVKTSTRRFRQNGMIRQQWRSGWILLRFKCGASPHRLAREYEREGTSARSLNNHESERRREPVVKLIDTSLTRGKH